MQWFAALGPARTRRFAFALALTAVALSVPAAAGAAARPSARPSGPCPSSGTLTWLGLGNGGGTISTTFYPVEISNTSSRTCTLAGFPAVWTVSGSGVQVGLPATTGGTPHPVVLRPGQTAHAVLAITPGRDVAGCKLRPGSYLQIRVPGQDQLTTIPGLQVTACANASVLRAGPVQSGPGLPGRSGPLSAGTAP